MSLTTLGLGVALLVAGPASDIAGRTTFIHLSLTASAVVAAACAFAPTWSALLVLRLLAGSPWPGSRPWRRPTCARSCTRLRTGAPRRPVRRRHGPRRDDRAAAHGGVAEAAGWRWAARATALLGVACAVVVRRLLPPLPALRSRPDRRPRAAPDDGWRCPTAGSSPCTPSAAAPPEPSSRSSTRWASGCPTPVPPGFSAASLVFLVYPVGSLSSVAFDGWPTATVGAPSCRWGACSPRPHALLTLAHSLPVLVLGLAFLTAGVLRRPRRGQWLGARPRARRGVATGQAASLYLFAFYLGSSVFGSLAGSAWTGAGWPGVVTLAVVLISATALLALLLRKTATPAGAQQPLTSRRGWR